MTAPKPVALSAGARVISVLARIREASACAGWRAPPPFWLSDWSAALSSPAALSPSPAVSAMRAGAICSRRSDLLGAAPLSARMADCAAFAMSPSVAVTGACATGGTTLARPTAAIGAAGAATAVRSLCGVVPGSSMRARPFSIAASAPSCARGAAGRGALAATMRRSKPGFAASPAAPGSSAAVRGAAVAEPVAGDATFTGDTEFTGAAGAAGVAGVGIMEVRGGAACGPPCSTAPGTRPGSRTIPSIAPATTGTSLSKPAISRSLPATGKVLPVGKPASCRSGRPGVPFTPAAVTGCTSEASCPSISANPSAPSEPADLRAFSPDRLPARFRVSALLVREKARVMIGPSSFYGPSIKKRAKSGQVSLSQARPRSCGPDRACPLRLSSGACRIGRKPPVGSANGARPPRPACRLPRSNAAAGRA